MHIDEETRTAIHRLWDEMAELPASAPEVCLNKLFTKISALIDSRHGLFVVMPVNEDVESYFMFDRLRGQPDFTPQDLEIASYALRSLGWLNRQIHLSYGQLMADAPLTPTERGVLKHMLAGSAEKNIAEAMGQNPHTTPQVRENPVPQIQCAQPRGTDRPLAGPWLSLTALPHPQTMSCQ